MHAELIALLNGALTGSGLFDGVTTDQILGLAPGHGRVEEGGVLFRQGDPGQHAYLLLRGILGLQAGGQRQGNTYFRKVVAGELVGEYGPLCGEPRSASAVALNLSSSVTSVRVRMAPRGIPSVSLYGRT